MLVERAGNSLRKFHVSELNGEFHGHQQNVNLSSPLNADFYNSAIALTIIQHSKSLHKVIPWLACHFPHHSFHQSMDFCEIPTKSASSCCQHEPISIKTDDVDPTPSFDSFGWHNHFGNQINPKASKWNWLLYSYPASSPLLCSSRMCTGHHHWHVTRSITEATTTKSNSIRLINGPATCPTFRKTAFLR